MILRNTGGRSARSRAVIPPSFCLSSILFCNRSNTPAIRASSIKFRHGDRLRLGFTLPAPDHVGDRQSLRRVVLAHIKGNERGHGFVVVLADESSTKSAGCARRFFAV